MDRKHFSFLMLVIDGGHLNAAGGYAEGRVLDSLEFLNQGWSGVSEPNWSCIHENYRIRDVHMKGMVSFC